MTDSIAVKVLYTPLEAASALGVSRSTLYLLLSSGQINSVKVGALRRIPVDALADFVDRLRTEPSNEHRPDWTNPTTPKASHPAGTIVTTSEHRPGSPTGSQVSAADRPSAPTRPR
jgi:excisionase family DNA binding protein